MKVRDLKRALSRAPDDADVNCYGTGEFTCMAATYNEQMNVVVLSDNADEIQPDERVLFNEREDAW